MAEVPVQALRQAIRDLHGCDATFVQAVPVVERWRGAVAWEGAVCVFNLTGHPQAQRAYAWSHEAGAGGRRRFIAVLHAGPVDSPAAAVRASIAADHGAGR